MKIFIWQWGRRGAGPRYAHELAWGLRHWASADILLSLSRQAEIYSHAAVAAAVDFPVDTFKERGAKGLVKGLAAYPFLLRRLAAYLQRRRPDIALCAMPGFSDLPVVRLLKAHAIPVVSVVHDASCHPGDWFSLLYRLQELQIRAGAGVVTLTRFVHDALEAKGLLKGKACATIEHIPFLFPDLDIPPPTPARYPARQPLRVLLTGRLQRYKGIDLFGEALRRLPAAPLTVRVVGRGDERALADLERLPNVKVENRWMSERELISCIDWSDVVVAPYIEASQSGVVTLAQDRGRPVIVTPVGGLPEQVRHERTGLVTRDASAPAVAEALRRFLEDSELYGRCALEAFRRRRRAAAWDDLSARYLFLCREARALFA